MGSDIHKLMQYPLMELMPMAAHKKTQEAHMIGTGITYIHSDDGDEAKGKPSICNFKLQQLFFFFWV